MNEKAEKLLSMMSEFTFGELTDDLSKDRILKCFIYSEPDGILFVKERNDGYGITISFSDENGIDLTQIEAIVNEYIQIERFDRTYAMINTGNFRLRKFLFEKGFDHWFGSREYEYTGSFGLNGDDITLLPYESSQSDEYIRLLGKAFEDMRRENNLEPYDWYEANRESSIRHFDSMASKGQLKGWWNDGSLEAVTIIEDDYLDTIAVRKDLQGKGLGQRLLANAMDEILNKNGHSRIRLGLIASNTRAINLYSKNGFTPTASMDLLRYFK